MVFILILPAVIYYIFSWSTSIEERSQLGPGNFYMVSFADIYAEVESISKTWYDDAILVEAWFHVYPSPNYDQGIMAYFEFRSPGKSNNLSLYASYRNGEYMIFQAYKYEALAIVQVGSGTPLPEAYSYQDSLIAFEALYPLLEESIKENFIEIQWPMELKYWTNADGTKWELCYAFEDDPDNLSQCSN